MSRWVLYSERARAWRPACALSWGYWAYVPGAGLRIRAPRPNIGSAAWGVRMRGRPQNVPRRNAPHKVALQAQFKIKSDKAIAVEVYDTVGRRLKRIAAESLPTFDARPRRSQLSNSHGLPHLSATVAQA